MAVSNLLARLVAPVRRRGFPFTAPTWPGGVERPPVERTLGSDYDASWGRKPTVRAVRAVLLDGVTRPVVHALAAPAVHGEDRLVGLDGPVVFAANHASHLDTPLLLVALPERFRHRAVVAAGADYFFDRRWKAVAATLFLAAIPVERSKVSRRSAQVAEEAVRDGWSLVIFPEGGRSPDGWGQGFKPGAAWVAARVGVPVVPVHLEGTRRILRKGRSRITPSTTTVTFGAPLRAEPKEDPRDFAARIERAVTELADEQASDWWSARRRAAAGATPPLRGPGTSPWRRSWDLGEGRRVRTPPRWPR